MQCYSQPFRLKEFKVEVTYQCDLNCIHCSSDARPSNPLQMGRQDCLRILADAEEMGAEDIAFSGGEPLLWPHVYDAVEAAVKHGLKVTVYTSGNAKDVQGSMTRIRDRGASRIIFSLFGATTNTHERVTRKAGSFKRTTDAIRDARALGIETQLHFVPMSGNYRELSDVASLGRKLGASRISVLRLVPQGRAALVRDRILSRVQNQELRREVLAVRKKYGDDFIRTGSPYNFLMLNEKPACWAGMNQLIVGPDLRLYPCDAFKMISASELVGADDWSCLATASLPECWMKSPYLRAVRTHLTTGLKDPCKSCKLLEKCASGCLAQKAIAYGSLDKNPDPDCLGPAPQGEVS